jgi:hypothetical protein
MRLMVFGAIRSIIDRRVVWPGRAIGRQSACPLRVTAATSAGEIVFFLTFVTDTPLGRLQAPNPTLLDKWNVRTPYRSPQGDSMPQGTPMAVRVWDVGRSECRAVTARMRVETSPGTKVSLLEAA